MRLPWPDTFCISICGSKERACEEAADRIVRSIAERAQQRIAVVTGGYGGTMLAANKAAVAVNIESIGIRVDCRHLEDHMYETVRDDYPRTHGVRYYCVPLTHRRRIITGGDKTKPINVVVVIPGRIGTIAELADAIAYMTKYAGQLKEHGHAELILVADIDDTGANAETRAMMEACKHLARTALDERVRLTPVDIIVDTIVTLINAKTERDTPA